MLPSTILIRTRKGQEQAINKTQNLPGGLNRILELTEETARLQEIVDRFPQIELRKLLRGIEYLVQKGFLATEADGNQKADINYLSPPLIEVEELDAQAGLFAWAEARRGAKMLADKGFYAQSTLARAPAHTPGVLLVEDDNEMAEVVTLLLSGEGLRVHRVADAEQAVAVLDGGMAFDLALLDVILPGMDGFELLGLIRGNPDYGSLPVIMVTGRAADEDVMRGLLSGADGYIFKPFSPPMLIGSVRKMLGMQSIGDAGGAVRPEVA